MMAGAGRELAVAHGAQFPAHRLLGDPHPELLPDPLAEIDETPAHDPVDGGCRPGLDQLGQRLAVLGRQSRGRAGALRSIRPAGPWALNFTTQSRTICTVTPPIRAASLRDAPS